MISGEATNFKVLIALTLSLLCGSISAANIEAVSLQVDDHHFAFDIVVAGLPASLSPSSLRINTKFNLFVTPTYQEQFLVSFITQTGEIIDGPGVQTLDSPELDRWQDGDVEDFTLSEISP